LSVITLLKLSIELPVKYGDRTFISAIPWENDDVSYWW
jgi:hypothetical protein